MALRKINESTLTAIGNAIRAKTGGSALINPEDMASEIESIETGGGTVGYTLLASGTYTLDANASSMTIPVSYTGTPIAVFVEAQSFSNEGNQTAAWFSFKPTFSDAAALFPLVEQCKIANANGYLSNRAITGTPCSFDNNSIVLYQYSGSIPIRANTYNWYIWGVAQ